MGHILRKENAFWWWWQSNLYRNHLIIKINVWLQLVSCDSFFDLQWIPWILSLHATPPPPPNFFFSTILSINNSVQAIKCIKKGLPYSSCRKSQDRRGHCCIQHSLKMDSSCCEISISICISLRHAIDML